VTIERLVLRPCRFSFVGVVCLFSALVGCSTIWQFRDPTLSPLSPLTDVEEIAAGANHTCVRRTDGTVMCWGQNGNGQIGDGTTSSPRSPTRVLLSPGGEPLKGVAQIAAGANHSCARKFDGEILCWGDNALGQIGDGTTTLRPSPTSVLLAPSGGVPKGVAQIAAGGDHTCAGNTDGTVLCWGDNSRGQIGDGTVSPSRPAPTPVLLAPSAPLLGVAEIATGNNHTCARRVDETLVCWGDNASGEIGDGTVAPFRASATPAHTGLGVIEVAASDGYTCVRKEDGAVLCWGDNSLGQIGADTSSTPLPSPTRVLAAADDSTPQHALTDVVEIARGAAAHSCARRSTATVVCWGDNAQGQIGDGTTRSPRASAVAVLVGAPGSAPLENVAEIATGKTHTCARKANRTVVCWGDNRQAQIGDGTTTPRPSPTPPGQP
jgi:alpha-tubulin suppressor-like RCC1 family protein